VIFVNGLEETFEGETVEALLTRRGIDTRGVAVAIDGEVAPRSTWSATLVPDDSHVEIVTAAAGG
jgi:sulfur carrier protein